MEESLQTNLEPTEFVSKFIGQTNKNIFLTGKAGTGKTTLLHQIVSNTYKKCIVAAPTGIAAINAKGVTLHSLFQLPFGSFIPEIQISKSYRENSRVSDPTSLIKNLQMFDAKRKLLRELELLIIDEVSMLRADLLDAIDLILRHVRRKNHIPFGGVQILFIGDLLQLPPVIKDDEWDQLKPFYKSIYFFDSRVLQQNKPVYIELDKIYRQADEKFITLLAHLRDNILMKEDFNLLNTYFKPDFKSTPEDNYITLTTHNYKATELNKNFLERLPEKSYFFEAKIEGDFYDNSYPLEKTLELKKGSQIMFVKNDPSGQQRFFNGRIGVVSALTNESIEVTFNDTKNKIIVEPYKWENIKYKVNGTNNEIEESVSGTFTHYPIKLAWAITVHKSQGLTFDKAIIDIGSAFAPGQVYVALSRLRSLSGLVLTSQINTNSISSDEKIADYSKKQTEEQNLPEILNDETHHYLKSFILKCFDFSLLMREVQEHADSYRKTDESKSIKQKHHNWAKELEKQISEIKPIAEKFKNQVAQILEGKQEGYLDFLNKRVQSASEYFLPAFKNFTKQIFKHIEEIKGEKKIKTYLQELLELEILFFEQQKLINKSVFVIEVTLFNKEYTGADVKKLYSDIVRDEQLRQVNSMPLSTGKEGQTETITKEKKPRVRKPKGAPKEKIDTKLETFKLYKEGKNVLQISQERKMTPGTIEGHLAHYVTKGELKGSDFISNEKAEKIIATAKKLNTLFFGQIKQSLGDEFTYSEIKFAIASYLSTDPENK